MLLRTAPWRAVCAKFVNLRHQLDQIHLVDLAGTTGHLHQRTELTAAQTRSFAALGVDEPPRFTHLTPA